MDSPKSNRYSFSAMATCKHCGGGGAKRPCPALKGTVCPRCCGQHQKKEIKCPVGCSFLRTSAGPDAYQMAVKKLIDFSFQDKLRFGQAFLKLSGPKRQVGEWEEALNIAYIAYGHPNADGDRAIDIFLREKGSSLRGDEAEALQALRDTAWFSLFEVQTVEVDAGLDLLDLATNERLLVREKSATHSLEKFDLMLAWVVWLGDHFEMTGPNCGVPRVHRELTLKAISKELRRLRKARPGVADKLLLRETAPAAQMALREAFASWRPPKMVTMDGKDIVFCQAIFDVSDAAAVEAKLAAHPNINDDNDGFTWVDRKGRKQLGAGPLSLGTIRVDGRRLVLETKSRERLERGREMLKEYLEGIARHRVDSIKDLDVALAEAAKNPKRHEPRDEIPADVQAQLLGPFMQQHIESWIDERLPALKGKTPREAVKTKAGRTKVVDMLRDQEHAMQGQPGVEAVDFAVVYRKLGLHRD